MSRLTGALRRLGLAPVPPDPRLELLRRLDIDVVLDVGANVGYYAKVLREGGFAGHIVSFEPASAAYAALEDAARDDPRWETRRLALGAADGPRELHVAGNSLSSSVLPMSPRHVAVAPESAVTGSETVTMARLDAVAPTLPSGRRMLLKLDVQGAELDVLYGAQSSLEHVVAIDSELSLVELYVGQPLITDVVSHLDAAGFALVHVIPEFRDERSNAILQVAGLFERRG